MIPFTMRLFIPAASNKRFTGFLDTAHGLKNGLARRHAAALPSLFVPYLGKKMSQSFRRRRGYRRAKWLSLGALHPLLETECQDEQKCNEEQTEVTKFSRLAEKYPERNVDDSRDLCMAPEPERQKVPASPNCPNQQDERDGSTQGRESEVVGSVDPRIKPEGMQVKVNHVLDMPLDSSTWVMCKVVTNGKVYRDTHSR